MWALVFGLSVGLFFGLLYGLVFGLVGALVGHEVDAKLIPNQGIRRSARTAILIGLVAGLVGRLALGLLYGPYNGVFVGLVFAATVGLIFGGYACISHIALRLVLWSIGALPLRTVSFVDYATERVFLRRVGGGYIFVHRLLQEHLAGLERGTTLTAHNHRPESAARQAGLTHQCGVAEPGGRPHLVGTNTG